MEIKQELTKEEKDKERILYNDKILRTLKKYLKENKNLRFIQVLTLLGINSLVDRFSEESEITYKRMKVKLQQIKEMRKRVNLDETNNVELNTILEKIDEVNKDV